MGKTQTRHKTDALLRGLMYGPDGGKYHITYSKKPSGKKYRYYIPKADKRYGYRSSATGMIPADQIEEVVVNLLVTPSVKDTTTTCPSAPIWVVG